MKPRILHLEDDPTDAELVAAALEDGGLECDVVHVSTEDAFAHALVTERLDLILSDYDLRGYNGFRARAHALEVRPACRSSSCREP